MGGFLALRRGRSWPGQKVYNGRCHCRCRIMHALSAQLRFEFGEGFGKRLPIEFKTGEITSLCRTVHQWRCVLFLS